jgi:type I restriction enzyme S subunit
MPTVKLGEICEINPATDYDFDPEEPCSFVPMEAVDDVDASIARLVTRPFREVAKGYTPFAENDVIVAKITPCMENGKCAIGRGLRSGVAFGSTEFHVLRAKKRVIPEWLLYFWRFPPTRKLASVNMTGSAGQKRVPASFLETADIPLPDMPEQRQIAGRLEQADRLRRTRRYALELTDTLLPAAFLELFGDPISNSHGWPAAILDDCCERFIDYRGRTPEYSSDGIPHVTAACIKEHEIQWAATKRVTETTYAAYMTRGLPAQGDVLLTTEAPLGESTVIKTDKRFSMAQRLLLIRPGPNLLSDYLCHLLGHRSFRSQLLRFSTGSTVKGISSESFRAIPIPLPPIPVQQKFASLVERVERLRSEQREALRQAEHLFASLLHRVFGGCIAHSADDPLQRLAS